LLVTWGIKGDIGENENEHSKHHNRMPEYRDKAADLIKLRSNFTGFFERSTEIIIIFIMIILTIFNTFYVPNYLKE